MRTFVELVERYVDPELCPYPEYKGKPYYSIKYIENGEEYVGYSTYNLRVMSEFLKKYFMSSAMEKQEQDRWIPVTERLPEEDGEYRITWKTSSNPGKRFIGDAEYEPGYEWDDAHDRFFGEWLLEDYVKAYPDVVVTAWKPIEEPYTEEDNDKP